MFDEQKDQLQEATTILAYLRPWVKQFIMTAPSNQTSKMKDVSLQIDDFLQRRGVQL